MCLKTSLFSESYYKVETLISDVLSMQVTKRHQVHACMTDAHAPHPQCIPACLRMYMDIDHVPCMYNVACHGWIVIVQCQCSLFSLVQIIKMPPVKECPNCKQRNPMRCNKCKYCNADMKKKRAWALLLYIYNEKYF